MDGGGHQETSRPQLAEGIRESRTGTAMLVFNRLQTAVSFTIVIYDGCKRKAFQLLARNKTCNPTRRTVSVIPDI